MLTITADDAAFRNDLAALYRRLGDLTPVMNQIGMELENRVRARFETRIDPTGRAWAPWSQSTIDSYPDDGNRKLLDRHGLMLRDLSHQADKARVRIGFGQPYTTYHEFGTKHMPRRGLLFADPNAGTLSKDDEKTVLDIIGSWLSAD